MVDEGLQLPITKLSCIKFSYIMLNATFGTLRAVAWSMMSPILSSLSPWNRVNRFILLRDVSINSADMHEFESIKILFKLPTQVYNQFFITIISSSNMKRLQQFRQYPRLQSRVAKPLPQFQSHLLQALLRKPSTQCMDLQSDFARVDKITIVRASPIRQTLKTALSAFPRVLQAYRPGCQPIRIMVYPPLNDHVDGPASTGRPLSVLKEELNGTLIDLGFMGANTHKSWSRGLPGRGKLRVSSMR